MPIPMMTPIILRPPTVALNGTLTDEENAAYAAAQVKVIEQFAEVEGAIASLEADILRKVSQSLTGEEVRGSSDFDKYQD